jgi:NADPH:quinone reductase-like Zn-dependent oxidoreductase
MKAFTLDGFDAQPALRDDLPEPRAGENELVVRVHASSVNPVDAFIVMGALKETFEYEFPVTLGRDFAGVVEQVGDGVSRYRVGDEVFGFVPHADQTVHAGSWAELITLPEDNFVAAKPESVDFAAAGAAPVAGLTAVAAFDSLAPTEGETVLVIGATGGVGSFFVQLAASVGANVIAPALPEDDDYLRGLGVGELLDRNAEVASALHEAHPDGAHAILDAVSQAPDASLLREGGRLASPVGAAGDWLETDSKKPCPMSCAARVSNFDVDDIEDAGGVHRIASAEDIEEAGAEDEQPSDSYWVGFTDGAFVYTVDLHGPPGSVSEEQALEIANAYHDRLTGS